MLLVLQYLKRNLFHYLVDMTVIQKITHNPVNFYRKLLSDEKSTFNSAPSPVLGHSRQGSASSCVSSISSNSQNQQSEEDGGGIVLVLSLLTQHFITKICTQHTTFALKIDNFCTRHMQLLPLT